MRILIVDDNPIGVSVCRALLEADWTREVLETSDGLQGYSVYFARVPDIAIVNLNLHALSGPELVRRILRRKPQARILAFTMNDDPVLASQAIEAGARGYVTNKDGPALFSSAVRSVAEGAIFLRPEIAREIAFIRASAKAAKISDLKPREIKVLRLLAAGWSMAEIAAETNLSYKTVANSCTRLKQRLGAPSMADLVRVALEWRL